MRTPRIAVASIMQESNTFSPRPTSFADFEAQGIYVGDEMFRLRTANTEAAGAFRALERRGAEIVPLVRASALSGGALMENGGLDRLASLLEDQLLPVLPVDGVVLSLHGALVTEAARSGDAALLSLARALVGPECPIGVCLDLHAYVTEQLVEHASFVLGYRTYPHVDQAATGERTAELLLDVVEGSTSPVTRMAIRHFLSNPEAEGDDGPLGELRQAADTYRDRHGLIDISLFPVQPWLDLPDLGFVVTATSESDPEAAERAAETIVERAWARRRDFVVELHAPKQAVAIARGRSRRPTILVESADATPGGATGDSPAMISALLEHGPDLRAYVTLVDAAGVAACARAGEGAMVTVQLGASIDRRFHQPVEVTGVVRHVGDGSYPLTGPASTGLVASMGRRAVLDVSNLSILVTERPAITFDPETFRQVGLVPELADAVVVRSCTLFRAGWGPLADDAVVLDLPGATTPRLAELEYRRATRPLYPLDEV